MKISEDHPQLVTPESIAAYVGEAPPASHDFDFLLGEWDAEAVRYGPDGAVQLRHRIDWRARAVGRGRMIIDQCTGYLPDGTEVSHMATLRTYCPAVDRWEMTFLAAMQPPLGGCFHGRRVGDEMVLRVEGADAAGRSVEAKVRFHDIEPDSFRWEQVLRIGERWIRDVAIEAKRRATT